MEIESKVARSCRRMGPKGRDIFRTESVDEERKGGKRCQCWSAWMKGQFSDCERANLKEVAEEPAAPPSRHSPSQELNFYIFR